MGTTDGGFSNRGSTRIRALLPLATTLCVAAFATGPIMPSAAGAKVTRTVIAHRFPAVRVHAGVVTFKPKGISPGSIDSGYVKHGGDKRGLPLRRIRAAARRGVLRMHMAERRRRKKPTLIIVTDPPPPAPSPVPGPAPAPAPGPAPGPVVSWRAVGSAPLSDAAAKALVTTRAETRTANAVANHYLPTAPELSAFHAAGSFNRLERYVSGGFAGTTDEILQWGAHKWGIPEDVLRAVAVTESWWRQSGMGDRRDGVDASLYPAQSRIDFDSVYETLGLMQIKWRPDGSLHPGTEPLRWKSTAFNVDYWGASIRYYYDGLCDWCTAGYGVGQAWNSVGAWFNPWPWTNSGAQAYVAQVRDHIANRTWAGAGF
jgi:hypothetical protein